MDKQPERFSRRFGSFVTAFPCRGDTVNVTSKNLGKQKMRLSIFVRLLYNKPIK